MYILIILLFVSGVALSASIPGNNSDKSQIELTGKMVPVTKNEICEYTNDGKVLYTDIEPDKIWKKVACHKKEVKQQPSK